MGTRSMIGILNENGSVEASYCHWDGYLSHNGKILLDHYTTEEKIRELLSHGDMSSLGPEIGTKHDWEKRTDDTCTFYGRDRGEEGTESKAYDSVENLLKENGQEHNYIYNPKTKQWFWGNSKATKLKRLTQKLIDKQSE